MCEYECAGKIPSVRVAHAAHNWGGCTGLLGISELQKTVLECLLNKPARPLPNQGITGAT